MINKLKLIENLIKEVRSNLETIRVCNHCEGEVTERFCGTEGVSVCTSCGVIEGGDEDIKLWEYEELQDVHR